MTNVILKDVTNILTGAGTINENSERIEDAFQKTLSRVPEDGSNQMETLLDMNKYPIINLPKADRPGMPITYDQIDPGAQEVVVVPVGPDELTHDPELLKEMSNKILVEDGNTIQDSISAAKTPIDLLNTTKEFPIGSIIRTSDGFLYQVAPADATDAHLTTAGGVKLYVVDDGSVTVSAFGATYTGDESAIAQKMIDVLGVLRVPRGRVLTMKNIELHSNDSIEVDGTLRLPDGCVDFDRLLYGTALSSVRINIHELDGNFSGQSGNIGTHLLYFPELADSTINVGVMRDHYTSAGAPMPSVDGWRNTSSGPLFIPDGRRCVVNVGLISGWGREAAYLLDCEDCEVTLGHAQGTGLTEYSAVQVSGERNKILRGSADNCGASAFGFDTRDGEISNILSTNTREQHGVNFGHPGRPASRSVASNIVVDGAWVSGIAISSSTQDLLISNFSISNAGSAGVQQGDGSDGARLTSGYIRYAGRYNVLAGGAGTSISLSNTDADALDPLVLHLTSATGKFQDGETVSGPSGSGVIRRAIGNLTGAQQKLFLSSVTGTFTASNTVTGSISGATGSVSEVVAPVRYHTIGGAVIAGDSRIISDASGTYVAHADGTAEFWGTPAVAATANVLGTHRLNFGAGMLFHGESVAMATVRAASDTGGFDILKLAAVPDLTGVTFSYKFSYAQTYFVGVYVRGRWR